MEFDPELLRFRDPQTILCRECSLAPPDFTRAVCFGTYQAELPELIRLLKFEGVRGVARLLGSRLAQAILSLEPDIQPNSSPPSLIVIAVPLFARRQRERGYNQSTLLADAALRHLSRLRPQWTVIRGHHLLERQRSTESSFVLSRRERRRNLRGAFRLRPGANAVLQDRDVLLIDDILTSGATARECARILVRGGAANVWVVTLARAQKQSVLDQHQRPAALVAAWDLQLSQAHPAITEE